MTKKKKEIRRKRKMIMIKKGMIKKMMMIKMIMTMQITMVFVTQMKSRVAKMIQHVTSCQQQPMMMQVVNTAHAKAILPRKKAMASLSILSLSIRKANWLE
mgnify:CR=1 FL=1